MKKNKAKNTSTLLLAASWISVCCILLVQVTATKAQSVTNAKSLSSAQEAANALIEAAEKFDEAALSEILGPDSYDIIHTGEPARDREVAQKFAEQARIKTNVSLQPKNPRRATLALGEDDWPCAVPVVKVGSTGSFDAKAGRQELLYRRIGSNE